MEPLSLGDAGPRFGKLISAVLTVASGVTRSRARQWPPTGEGGFTRTAGA